MSEGERIPRQAALDLADQVIAVLSPHCERIEIAGSLRRGKPDVGDIEIVCIPCLELDLFGTGSRTAQAIETALREAGYSLAKNGEHFKQFSLGVCKCDLFITVPECWGVIFTIRTGSADFSHRLVTPRNQGGLLPSYLKVKDGRIWHGDTCLETWEESDVFQAAGLDWIPPEARK